MGDYEFSLDELFFIAKMKREIKEDQKKYKKIVDKALFGEKRCKINTNQNIE